MYSPLEQIRLVGRSLNCIKYIQSIILILFLSITAVEERPLCDNGSFESIEFESVAIVDADIPKRDLEFLRNRAGHVMTLDEARSAQL